MEKINEIWFYEYSLTYKGITRTFISAVADYTKESAIRIGKRHAAVTAGMTLIGPVKFVREVTESAPKPDADGWIPHQFGNPEPDWLTDRIDCRFADGAEEIDVPLGYTNSHYNFWTGPCQPGNQITHYRLRKA